MPPTALSPRISKVVSAYRSRHVVRSTKAHAYIYTLLRSMQCWCFFRRTPASKSTRRYWTLPEESRRFSHSILERNMYVARSRRIAGFPVLSSRVARLNLRWWLTTRRPTESRLTVSFRSKNTVIDWSEISCVNTRIYQSKTGFSLFHVYYIHPCRD